MLTPNQKIKAIWAYLGKKVSKAWIKGNLTKYLAIYEVRESGMVIPFPKNHEQEESKPSSPDLSCIEQINTEEVENSAKLITVDNILEHLKTIPYSTEKSDQQNQEDSESNESNYVTTAAFFSEAPIDSVETPKENTKYSEEQISKIKISFAETSEELLSGNKTQTRRIWSELHAKRVQNAWRKEQLITAKDSSFRTANSQTLALLKIKNMYKQKLAEMTYTDVIAEGFEGFSPKDFINQFFDGDGSQTVWVVEFEIIKNFSEEIKEAKYAKTSEKGFITSQAFRAQIQEGIEEIAKEKIAKTETAISAEEFAKKRKDYLQTFVNSFNNKYSFPVAEKALYDKSFLYLTKESSTFRYQEALKRFLYLKVKDIKNTWNWDYDSIRNELEKICPNLKALPLKNWWATAYKTIYPEFKAYFDQHYYQQLTLF